jgi:hypothetical protein
VGLGCVFLYLRPTSTLGGHIWALYACLVCGRGPCSAVVRMLGLGSIVARRCWGGGLGVWLRPGLQASCHAARVSCRACWGAGVCLLVPCFVRLCVYDGVQALWLGFKTIIPRHPVARWAFVFLGRFGMCVCLCLNLGNVSRRPVSHMKVACWGCQPLSCSVVVSRVCVFTAMRLCFHRCRLLLLALQMLCVRRCRAQHVQAQA